MELYTIRNDRLTVTVSPLAAELQSIRSAEGIEYLWQGDPAYWASRAPTLFPYIARLKDGCYDLDGRRYSMKIHGLAPYTEFVCDEHTDDALTLSMSDTAETLRQYPRRFRFSVRFHLEQNRLCVAYHVENRDDKPMFFAVGGHPGFRVPLVEGPDFADYRLRFSSPCRPKRIGFTPEVLVSGEETPYPLQDGCIIPLRHDLFHDDAIVLRDVGHEIVLENPADTHSVTVSFPGMPYLGIWHRPDSDAPYVCIEPWSSLPGRSDAVTALETQADLLSLPAGGEYTNRWSITIA